MSGQCSLSSHGVCQRLKGIPKRQLGWVRKFRSINWVTNECTKSAMKCSFSRRFACETHFEKISVYFIWIYFTTSSSPLQGISPHPQSLTSPTSMVVFLVDCPNAWPPSPWGIHWGPVPQAAHGANGQRLKELHSNGCIFSSLASLAQKKNDQLSREISGRWSVFSQKIVDFVFGNLYWYVWKDSQRVWDPHMELHFKLKRALVYSSFIQSRVGWCLAIR